MRWSPPHPARARLWPRSTVPKDRHHQAQRRRRSPTAARRDPPAARHHEIGQPERRRRSAGGGMNYSSLSASDLLKHRSHHVDSLTRLRRALEGFWLPGGVAGVQVKISGGVFGTVDFAGTVTSYRPVAALRVAARTGTPLGTVAPLVNIAAICDLPLGLSCAALVSLRGSGFLEGWQGSRSRSAGVYSARWTLREPSPHTGLSQY